MSDAKLTLRLLLKQPLTSTLIAFVLGLGIFGNAAMFSLFSGLFLTPLPFPDSDRLVDLEETAPQWGVDFAPVAYPDFFAWRAENRAFAAIAAYRDDSMNLALADGARRVTVAKVTHDLATVLRLAPVFGRHIAPEEDARDAPKVVLLVESTWREQFSSDPHILGTTLSLDSELYEVIGILPESSRFIENAEAWIPLATSVDENPGAWYLSSIGRLNPNVGIEEARLDLERIHKGLVETRSVNEITSPVVLPVLERFLGRYRRGTAALLVAVGVVLLMACANVSGLMLVRAKSREREFGIRAALGASLYRIVRQLLVESLVFALAGGVVGALLGHCALRFAVAHIPQEVPQWIRFDLDTGFLTFSTVIIVAATIFSGFLPAVRAAQTDRHTILGFGTSDAAANSGQPLGASLLVVAEVALVVVLLVGSGLLIQSVRSILAVDPGFRPDGLLTYRLSLPLSDYGDAEQRYQFFERHLEQVSALAGVENAGVVNTAPLGKHEGAFFEAEGQPPRDPDAQSPVALARVASAGYFRAIGVNLLRGRLPEPTEHSARVALVNEEFVSTFWPDESIDSVPGKRIRPTGGTTDSPWLDVIGVVEDVKHYGLDAESKPGIYSLYGRTVGQVMTVVVRTRTHPESLIAPARAALRQLDPAIPLYDGSTMQERIDESLWPRRAATTFSTLFAMYALLLACAGIYGVLAVTVSGRRRELGIRLALGAERRDVILSVLYQGMGSVLIGVAVGLAVALLVGQVIASFLFGVSANDLPVYVLVAGIVLILGAFANWIPARRAARIDVLGILRVE